jgi:hypothetical protein
MNGVARWALRDGQRGPVDSRRAMAEASTVYQQVFPRGLSMELGLESRQFRRARLLPGRAGHRSAARQEPCPHVRVHRAEDHWNETVGCCGKRRLSGPVEWNWDHARQSWQSFRGPVTTSRRILVGEVDARAAAIGQRRRGADSGSTRNCAANLTAVAAHEASQTESSGSICPLRWRVLQTCGDAVVHRVCAGADLRYRSEADDCDQCEHQAILDHRCAVFLSRESTENGK